MLDLARILLSIAPKDAAAQLINFIKSAIHYARAFSGHKRKFTGQEFLSQEVSSLSELWEKTKRSFANT